MPNTDTSSPQPSPTAAETSSLGATLGDAPKAPAQPPSPSVASSTASGDGGGSSHSEGSASPVQATPEASASGEGTPAAAPQEGGAAAAPVVLGPDGQPLRKRRRRRRKKGPRPEGAGATGAAGEATAGAEGEDEGEEEADGEPKAEGDASADTKPEGEARRDGKKRPKKDRPHRDQREPRERPAFNLGDVVFGKIIEITDEVLFVDLAGKGKAVFDLRELTLPDDPQDAAAAAAAEAEAEAAEDAATGEGAAAEGDAAAPSDGVPPPTLVSGSVPPPALETAEAAADPGADMAVKIASAVPEGFVEAPTEPGSRPAPVLIPTGDPNRRIVKPRHIVEAEAKPAPSPDAAPAAEGSAAPAEGDAAAAPAAEAAPEAEAPAAEAPRGPTPPMYAPPVVLELGAHFVGLVHNDGSRGGLVVLTHHPHRASKAKLAANAALKEKTTIQGLVTGVVKGGVEVDIDGLRAFTPGSHMDLRLGSDLHHYIGQRLEFLVTQYGKRGRDVVLSRRPMLEAGAKALREEALAKLTPGSIVEGTVRSVVSFGAFIDVGGVEGLVPLPEMSHNRSDSPSDVFKAGQVVAVKFIRIDERGKVWLSRKAAIPDPWAEVAKKYAVGTRHSGKIVRLQPFGAFVELETAVDGLIHTVDLSVKRIEDPSEVVKVGDSIDVVVASVDPGAHKIGLHPAPAGAAADEPHQRVQLHKPVKCAVVAVEAGGLVVRILGATGRHARGFITAAATGTPRGTELRKPFPVGTQLDAKVVEIDPKRGEVKLSIKALKDDGERNAYQQYRAQVKQEAKFGTFADLLAKKVAPPKA